LIAPRALVRLVAAIGWIGAGSPGSAGGQAMPRTTSLPPSQALYVNAWAFGSNQRFDALFRRADTTEINTFVVDVKDDTGYLTYLSQVPTAIAIGANLKLRARDAAARVLILKRHGIRAVARIVVAKDPLLADQKPEWAIQDERGGLWRDRKGFRWVDAFRDSVWIYASDLATEAVRIGFDEIQYDYVRFPDEPKSRMARAVFPARQGGESSRDGVSRNLKILGQRTRALKVPFTIDIFGLTTTAIDDMGIGQQWEDLVTTADVVLPMVYPSHYQRGVYEVAAPNSAPHTMVRRALQDGIRRSAALGKPTAEIRPYLQAFTLGEPTYTAFQVKEQIRAAEELGIKSWVLWNPGSHYDPKIFRPDPRPLTMP
jgi:hypothetical protein